MNKWGAHSFAVCALVANLSSLSAATPAIGVATSSGSVTVDNSVVPGNATLFDGNTVETGATSSRLQMKDGKLARLGSDSTAKVYSDHLVLEKGFGETYGNMAVDANSLRITGDSARVSMRGKTVEVAALGTPVLVSTSTGIQLANLMPGRALAFTPQDAAGAMAPATMTGVVRKMGTNYMLTDTTSNVTVQLTGGNIEKYVKHMVTVTGTPGGGTPAAGASQVLTVTNVTDQGKGKMPGGAGMGSGNGAVVIAGIAILAGAGVTAGVLATQNNNSSPVTLSPSL